MKVLINKQEGYQPYVYIKADENATCIVTIDEWIKMLQLAKAWLQKKQAKK
jgi:hypothetical protein